MPMEFGIFVQGYIPKWKSAADPDAEHTALMEDLELAKAADKAGFKYVWASEHHFLEEYSHLSANDVFLGYLAHATERAHLGSGIFNPLPQVNHPAKVAERVAMLDHLSGNRFEFGTGAGRRQPRDPRLPPRHGRPERHQGDLGGRHRRVPQDVAAGRVPGLPGQVLVAARPARSSPSRGARVTRPCGTPPATPRATRWRPARASACWASRSAPSPTSRRSWTRTRRPSPTPSRSVPSSTTT